MAQFFFYWKRALRRRGLRVNQPLIAVIVFAAVLGTLILSWNRGKTEAPDVYASAQTPFIAPQPDRIAPRAAENSSRISTKPQLLPVARPTIANHLSSIQEGVSTMLEAGNNLLVSEKKVVVGRGDTLMDLLVKKASVPREEAYQAVQALSKVYDPRDIRSGREITVFFHKAPSIADPKFSGVRIEKDVVNVVTVDRDGQGGYTVKKAERGTHRVLRGFRGTINNSLYVDAQDAGVPNAIILNLIKMYSWNVDFQREIHARDKFEVMYEEYRTDDGKLVPGKGNIVYAKLSLSGQSLPFYRFEEKNGDVSYYDDAGRSAKKPLMKTPIDGARLSSGYGMRKHPVLGFTKMHKGVDFAAPRGTPIYAAGDGTIEKIGPFSSFGNYIRIRHRNDLKTAYAHMKGFKAGLHGGSRVKQGQVIGYVGTTGRSTGPHLHYEVIVNNVQVNPASVKMPIGKALHGNELKSFQKVVAQARTKFNTISNTTSVADSRPIQPKSEKVVKN